MWHNLFADSEIISITQSKYRSYRPNLLPRKRAGGAYLSQYWHPEKGGTHVTGQATLYLRGQFERADLSARHYGQAPAMPILVGDQFLNVSTSNGHREQLSRRSGGLYRCVHTGM